MTSMYVPPVKKDRELLLEDPAKFYGKSGNWLSRLVGSFLRFIS